MFCRSTASSSAGTSDSQTMPVLIMASESVKRMRCVSRCTELPRASAVNAMRRIGMSASSAIMTPSRRRQAAW
jgi:hypothetical protein